MVAIFSKATSANGVVAHADSENPNQFLYYPQNVPLSLGDNLKEFKVTYWGIGPKFFVKIGNRVDSSVGAVLAGRAAIDITDFQRQQIIAKIRNVFGVQNPQLKPMFLSNVSVKPVIATNTLELGSSTDINFPKTVQLGTAFNYLVGTAKNSLFAQFVATQQSGTRLEANPSFGINIVGEAEFEGDPWTVTVEADLSQVWTYVRRRVSAGVSLGWFRVSLGEYTKIIQDLQREQIIKITYKEGSSETEKYGRQIFEMGKEIFEAVNRQANAQTGFFKFEPNRAPELSSGGGGGWGWSFSVNLSYSAQSLKSTQSLHYKNTISYKGRFKKPIPAAMSLAVNCNAASGQLFQDLGNVNEPCITQAKIGEFNKRLGEEYERKQRLLEKLEERYVLGEITEEQYKRAVNIITNGVSAGESFTLVPAAQALLVSEGESLLPDAGAMRSLNSDDLEAILLEAA